VPKEEGGNRVITGLGAQSGTGFRVALPSHTQAHSSNKFLEDAAAGFIDRSVVEGGYLLDEPINFVMDPITGRLGLLLFYLHR